MHNDLKVYRGKNCIQIYDLSVFLQVLLLKHPHDKTRDTSTYGPLRELAGSKRPALRTLAKKALGIDIQEGEHSSVSYLIC